MPSVGVNLKQAVSALNRYPYGCIEQTSSGLRGVIAFAQINGAYPDTRTKINAGINRIINKQRNSGAFGYWGKYSSVYERFQPYALETLQLAMPYADDQEHVLKAISKSLEYIYRSNFREIENRIYAYGLLAKSGYEVTSRIRYELDRVLDTERNPESSGFPDPGGNASTSISHTELSRPSKLKSKRKQNRCWWIGELIIGATIGAVSVPLPSATTEAPMCPVNFVSI